MRNKTSAPQEYFFQSTLGVKKILFLSFCLSIIAVVFFVSFEPSISTAASDIATTTVTLVVDSEISVTADATISMVPNVSMSQDTSIGNATFNVKTNDSAGYTLSFHASTSPALRNADDNFTDYTEEAEGTPEAWSVADGAYEFGFSAYGTDVDDGTWDEGQSSCGSAGVDSLTTSVKWMGFNGTTPVSGVASSGAETSQAGTDTELCVAVEQGDSVFAPSGTYNASVVGTVTTQ